MVHFYSTTKTLIASVYFFVSSLNIPDSAIEIDKRNFQLKPDVRQWWWHDMTGRHSNLLADSMENKAHVERNAPTTLFWELRYFKLKFINGIETKNETEIE